MSCVIAPSGDSSLTGSRVRPVRVSYFDPRTGEPCDSKPEPLGEHEQGSRRAEIAAATAPRPGRGRGIAAISKAAQPRDERRCVCRVCGGEFRAPRRGRKPSVCRECRAAAVAAKPGGNAGAAAKPSRYKPKVNELGGRRNAVPAYVDGKLFMSIREAAEAIDSTTANLATALRRGASRFKGHDVRRAL